MLKFVWKFFIGVYFVSFIIGLICTYKKINCQWLVDLYSYMTSPQLLWLFERNVTWILIQIYGEEKYFLWAKSWNWWGDESGEDDYRVWITVDKLSPVIGLILLVQISILLHIQILLYTILIGWYRGWYVITILYKHKLYTKIKIIDFFIVFSVILFLGIIGFSFILWILILCIGKAYKRSNRSFFGHAYCSGRVLRYLLHVLRSIILFNSEVSEVGCSLPFKYDIWQEIFKHKQE